MVRGLAEEPQAFGRRGGMLEIAAGIVEPVGGLGDPAQYRFGVDQAPGVTDGREQADRLVGRGGGDRDLAEHHRPGRAEQQARGAFPGQAALSSRLRALVGQFGGVVRAGLLEPQEGQVPLRVRPQPLVVQRARFAERVVEIILGSRDVARGGFQPAGQQQRCHAIACSDSGMTLGGFECGANAVLPGDPAPSTTHAQPKPLAIPTPSSGSWRAHQARAASMLDRSLWTNASHRGCAGPRIVPPHPPPRGRTSARARRERHPPNPPRAACRLRRPGWNRAGGSARSRRP